MFFESKKVVVIGDGGSGKTSLLMVYIKNEFPIEYIPTVFDSHLKEIELNNKDKINLLLMDTSGQEDYERLRNLQYIDTKLFVLCFSVDNYNSLVNIKTKWYPDIKSYHMPIILVGTKSDLRNVENENCIKYSDIKKIKQKIHATNYFECSAKNQTGINEIFESSAKSIFIENTKNKRKHCTLL